MSDNIIPFQGITKHDLSVEKMFAGIVKENPKHAFVVAWPEDGSMPTYHSTTGDTAVVLIRVQEFIHKFYNGDFV